MSGYIKLHRKLLKWEWYSDTITFRVFMHLLLTANFEEREYRGMVLKPGQLITGRKKLSVDLGLSEQQIRTALNHLQSTNEITIKSTKKFSVITVENWGKYQSCVSDTNQQNHQQTNQRNNQQATNKTTNKTTNKSTNETIGKTVETERNSTHEDGYTNQQNDQQSNQQSNHIQEYKEINNMSKILEEEFESIWKMYPKREGKKKAKAAYIRARKSGTTYEDVEAGIIAYKQHIAAQGIERQFIKMGSTYFNGKCWEDVYEEHSSSSGWSISDEEFAALAAAHEGVDEW